MKHGTQEVQPGLIMGKTWGKLPEGMCQRDIFQRPYFQTLGRERSQDKGETSHIPGYRGEMEPKRAYSGSFRLTRSRPTQLSSGFTQLRVQKVSGQESPYFTIPESFNDKTRTKGKEKDFFQLEEKIIRLNDPKLIGPSGGSAQKQQIIVNTSDETSTPTIKNYIPTKNEHRVITHENSKKSNEMWLKMSKFSEKTQKEF
ncbi:hypothetical protein O181_093230 [Austropuccinia psidii MF-1]|uniref:Uncharacterized protein n=1 Tax=Austropuccinia psidii MF-1 TaxID=1389203 RepID=A0A9Q3IZY2_9BASI|nr:hypothetical protein [Austropuccinia psidii MF-1]